MQLSDEDVILLLGKFVPRDKTGWRGERLDDHNRWRNWIDPAKIDAIADEELKTYFLEYFNKGAGRHPFNKIYRDRIVRPTVSRFRQTLKFLLDETVPVEQRLNDVLDKNGKHHIEGLGRGLATSILMDLNPLVYATWNNKTEMGLTSLGRMPDFSKNEMLGSCYLKVLREISEIRNLRSELTFLDIDYFLHVVSAEPEGIETVETLRRGGTIEVTRTEQIPQIDMEFAMEKYLEEFMETNFSKLNFGAKLELYDEDEESTGRQYPTSIGTIDLLAIDRHKREFVVIELKKGKTGDAVVGQVLRYMGWVKETLVAKHPAFSVRGIVVVREEDEKLTYALTQIPNVTGFTYNVSFDLKPLASKASAAKHAA